MPRTDEHFGPLASVLYDRDEAHKRIAALEAALRDLYRECTEAGPGTLERVKALLEKSEPK